MDLMSVTAAVISHQEQKAYQKKGGHNLTLQSNRKHVSKQPQAKFGGRERRSQCYPEFSNIFHTEGKKTKDPNAAEPST